MLALGTLRKGRHWRWSQFRRFEQQEAAGVRRDQRNILGRR